MKQSKERMILIGLTIILPIIFIAVMFASLLFLGNLFYYSTFTTSISENVTIENGTISFILVDKATDGVNKSFIWIGKKRYNTEINISELNNMSLNDKFSCNLTVKNGWLAEYDNRTLTNCQKIS